MQCTVYSLQYNAWTTLYHFPTYCTSGYPASRAGPGGRGYPSHFHILHYTLQTAHCTMHISNFSTLLNTKYLGLNIKRLTHKRTVNAFCNKMDINQLFAELFWVLTPTEIICLSFRGQASHI